MDPSKPQVTITENDDNCVINISNLNSSNRTDRLIYYYTIIKRFLSKYRRLYYILVIIILAILIIKIAILTSENNDLKSKKI
jgi:hypothetical protein